MIIYFILFFIFVLVLIYFQNAQNIQINEPDEPINPDPVPERIQVRLYEDHEQNKTQCRYCGQYFICVNNHITQKHLPKMRSPKKQKDDCDCNIL